MSLLKFCFQAIRQKISIRIKNVENPKGGGTVIHPDPDVDSEGVQQEVGTPGVPEPAALAVLQHLSLAAEHHQKKRLPTAVTIKERIMVLNVNSNRKNVSHGFFAGVFSTLDRFGVVVDLISTSEVHVSMAIEDNLNKKLLDRLVLELKKSGSVRFIDLLSITQSDSSSFYRYLSIQTWPFYLLWESYSTWSV